MKRKCYKFHFVGGNYDFTYETDGEDKSEIETRIRGVLERRLADLNLKKMVSPRL